ncbi:MAG: glycosyltransferase family 4 protein, partial [Thermodesulfovibrio sp.]|nr:glycosyltransferase family 4 protein [Thermodesulfovibrio sp.]
MKILINTIPLLAPLTGIGKYTYYIAKKLRELDKNNKYFYYYGYFSKQLKSEEKTFMKQFIHRTKELIKTTPFSSHLRKLKNYLAGFSLKTFDLYFEPNFILLDKIKTKHRVVSVFDFSFDKYPQWHPKERIDFFRNNFWKSIKKADRIIVPSNFILREAKEEYGFDESLMQTVYLGIDFEIFRNYPGEVINEIINKYSLPENYILFVGSIEPRKNLKNLLHAYQSLPNYIKEEFKLVIVGFSGWENKEIMKLLDKDKGNIIYTGYVSEKELACIYNKAQLLVFPSFYEGFGLPPIEAMACSCPVLVSNKASLPEICGEGAFYCDPNSSDSIA